VASWVCSSSICFVKVFTFMIVETIIVHMLGVLCEFLRLAISPFQCMTSDRQYSKHAWTRKKRWEAKRMGGNLASISMITTSYQVQGSKNQSCRHPCPLVNNLRR
jgi:hypothetical protein